MPKIPKKDARYQLWLRGNLRFKLHAAQKRIDDVYRNSTGRLFVGNCSRRLGKTYWACCKAIEVALTCELPFPKIFYASATKEDLKKYVITAFEQILVDCPIEIRPKWIASELKFVFPNGSEIYLLGLDKRPDAGRGTHADLYVFEEAGIVDNLEYLYSSVVSPMFATRPGARGIMISTPSSTPAHPFKDFCDRATLQNSYIEIPITENPMLDELQRQVALDECLSESDRQREYFCQHVIDENLAIIPEWSSQFAKNLEKPEHYNLFHKYIAMDLGTKIDLTAILYAYYDKAREVLVIEAEDEMTGPAMTSIALKNMIAHREQELWGADFKPYRRIADNNNALLLQDLGLLHQMWFISTGKDNLHAMVNQVRVLIKAGRLEVSNKCKKILGCLAFGIWNKQRSEFGRNRLYGHWDHLAALVYLVRNIDYVSNPLPLYGKEVQRRSHMIRPHKPDPEQILKLKNLFNIED